MQGSWCSDAPEESTALAPGHQQKERRVQLCMIHATSSQLQFQLYMRRGVPSSSRKRSPDKDRLSYTVAKCRSSPAVLQAYI